MKTYIIILLAFAAAQPLAAQDGRVSGEFVPREIPEHKADNEEGAAAQLKTFKNEINSELGKLGAAAQRLAPAIDAYKADPTDANLANLLQSMAASAATGRRGCDIILEKAKETRDIVQSASHRVADGLAAIERQTATRRQDDRQLRQTTESLHKGLAELAEVTGQMGFGSDHEIPEPLRKKIRGALRTANATEVVANINRWSLSELTEAENELAEAHTLLNGDAESLGGIIQDYEEMADTFSFVGNETGLIANGVSDARKAKKVAGNVREVVGGMEEGVKAMRKVLLGFSPGPVNKRQDRPADSTEEVEGSRVLLNELNQYNNTNDNENEE